MTAPVLEAQNVTVRRGDRTLLADVAVGVRPGEILGVLGPSGAGKTTLVRVLHLLERPTAGRVAVDGRPAAYRGAPWRTQVRRLALVQQTPGLLRTTALNNVAFSLRARGAPRTDAHARARSWLARLGLDDRYDAHARTLSGGEAQRVALARALATHPRALLLDEATNQLDPSSVRHVEAVLQEARAAGCAVVLVTHNVAQARRLADRVLLLEQGRVRAEGPAARLLDAPPAPLEAFLRYG